MTKHDWDESLSVGDPEIDADHQELFALINELETADRSDAFLADIIAALEDYAAHHFAREEELMREGRYPGYAGHVQKHQAFVEWLESVKSTYRRAAESPFELGDMVNDFLQEWLSNHIMKEDMKYRDFLIPRAPGP